MRATVLAGALVLAFAGTAEAAVEKAGGFKYVTEESRVKGGAGETETVKAPCPGNDQVISGGLTSDAGYAQLTFTGAPYDDADDGKEPDDGWRLTATNYVSGKHEIVGEAVCTKKLEPSYHSGNERVPAGQQRYVGLECGGTRAAVGGGMSGRVVMNSSWPPGGAPGEDFWAMYADNYTNNTRKVKTYAVCVEQSLRLDFSSASGSFLPGAPAGGFSGCAQGEVGVGGGHSNSGGFGTVGIRVFNPAPGGFGFGVDNYSAGTPNYNTHSICYDPSV